MRVPTIPAPDVATLPRPTEEGPGLKGNHRPKRFPSPARWEESPARLVGIQTPGPPSDPLVQDRETAVLETVTVNRAVGTPCSEEQAGKEKQSAGKSERVDQKGTFPKEGEQAGSDAWSTDRKGSQWIWQ